MIINTCRYWKLGEHMFLDTIFEHWILSDKKFPLSHGNICVDNNQLLEMKSSIVNKTRILLNFPMTWVSSRKILKQLLMLYFNNVWQKISECLQNFKYLIFNQSYCFLKVQSRARSRTHTNIWCKALCEKSSFCKGFHLRCWFEPLDTPQMAANTFSKNPVEQKKSKST